MENSPIQIDLSGLGQTIVDALVSGVQALFSPLPNQFQNWVLGQILLLLSSPGEFNVLTHVPIQWTTDYTEVQRLFRDSWPVMAGLIGVVGVIQGYRVSKGSLDVYDALFRVFFMAVLGASSLVWMKLVLNTVNAMADWVGTTPLGISDSTLPGGEVVFNVLLILAAIMAVLAWVKGVVGTLFVAVLLVLGPYLLVISTLPIFEGLGKWWAEELTTWCLRGVFVALILRLGLGMASHAGPMQWLFAAVAFWLAWTVDTKIRRLSVGAWGSIGNLQLMRRGAGMIRGAMTGNPAAAAATAVTP